MPLNQCDTLMLDMDGTILDLAFDNFMWLQRIPAVYARERGLDPEAARRALFERYGRLQGQLEWYCLDHWSERLGLDIVGLHHAERDRIGWLPGAEAFLAEARNRGVRLLLVTNSHPDTLAMKAEVTGLAACFDRLYSAHDLGYAKEQQPFWEALAALEDFDPRRTLFVDDTEPVLASAETFGVRHLRAVSLPDASRPPRAAGRYAAVGGVAELLKANSP
ncbi:MAG: GMP/IMP nucleotidase [Woeseiaceae bacterium]|nr:GMP/IMP nucleotidase [Woeseiaceae bacterium]